MTKESRDPFQELAKGGVLFRKLRSPYNVVSTVSELDSASISSNNFPFNFER